MLRTLLKGLSSLIGETVFDELQERIDATIDDAKAAAQQAVDHAVRQLLLVAFVIIGLIFGLVGIAKLLTETVPAFGEGTGYLVVALLILIIAWISKHASDNTKEQK